MSMDLLMGNIQARISAGLASRAAPPSGPVLDPVQLKSARRLLDTFLTVGTTDRDMYGVESAGALSALLPVMGMTYESLVRDMLDGQVDGMLFTTRPKGVPVDALDIEMLGPAIFEAFTQALASRKKPRPATPAMRHTGCGQPVETKEGAQK